ncbi:MAG: FAD:protein FMN transferase [Acidobacteria bacterium]|nr:FAD:protein FMN transferase [Acidobacteriota bacterium]
MTRLVTALALTSCAALAARGGAPALVARDVYVMGTRATLAAYAPTRDTGRAALDTALAVLDETEGELSTWRDTSRISALNHQPVGVPWQATPTLCHMFAAVWQWYEATGGAFDPGIGRLLEAWDVHGEGAIPTREAARRAQSLSGLSRLSFDSSRCTLTKHADATIDVGAFGKGEALDRVDAALGDSAWMINLGGQISVGGPTPAGGWPVAIADPRHRDRPFLQVRLLEGSLSTSGGSERNLVVNGIRVSHIFDPRSGQPARFGGSVSVWHRRGLAADALSTALFVMGPDEGLRWAEAHRVAALYLIPAGDAVRVAASAAFQTAAGVRVTGLE